MTTAKANAPGLGLAARPTRSESPDVQTTRPKSNPDAGIITVHYIAREDVQPAQLAAWDSLWRRLLGGDGHA